MADSPRVRELIDRHLDGHATDAEFAELGRMLAEDTAVADALVEAARFDGLLEQRVREFFAFVQGSRPGPVPKQESSPRLGRKPRRRRWAAMFIAALALMVAAVMSDGVRDSRAGHMVVSGRVEIDGVEVSSISNGATVRVAGEADAVLQLVDGSRATLSPDSEAVLREEVGGSRLVVELVSGRGLFEVERSDGRFRVETPLGTVTAVGTEFSVEIRSAATETEGADMRTKNIAVLTVVVLAGTVQVDQGGVSVALLPGGSRAFAADKVKAGFPLPSGDLVGFTGKGGRPMALEQTIPGIVGALVLTEDQRKQIVEAREEIYSDETLKAAKSKKDPDATEAEREASRAAYQAARERLLQRVSGILTAEQKALVGRINTATEEAQKAVGDALQADYAAAKGNPDLRAGIQRQRREKFDAEITARLAGILTPEQRAAMQAAAAEQKAAQEAAKNARKSKK